MIPRADQIRNGIAGKSPRKRHQELEKAESGSELKDVFGRNVFAGGAPA